MVSARYRQGPLPKFRYPQREMTIDRPEIQAWSPEFY